MLVCMQHHHHQHLHLREGTICAGLTNHLSHSKQENRSLLITFLLCCDAPLVMPPSLDPSLSFYRLYCKHYMHNPLSFAFIQIYSA